MAADVLYVGAMTITSDVLGFMVFRMKISFPILRYYVGEQVPSSRSHYTRQ
jgi:hypothetical protein